MTEVFVKALWIVLLLAGGLLFLWIVVFRICVTLAKLLGHSQRCPARFAWLIDNRVRRWWMRSVLGWTGLHAGEHVLEVGAGAGTFTLEAARRVGPEGKIIAIDIQPEMTSRVEGRVQKALLTNVEVLTADACQLPVPDASMDRILLIAVLFEIPDPARALAEIHRVLKPGGVVSVTEEFFDPDYPFRSTTQRRVEAAGFRLKERFGNFWVYTLNFTKGA